MSTYDTNLPISLTQYTRSVFTTRACHLQRCEQNYYFIRNNERIKASNLCNLQYSVKFQNPSAMSVRSIAVWYVTSCTIERHKCYGEKDDKIIWNQFLLFSTHRIVLRILNRFTNYFKFKLAWWWIWLEAPVIWHYFIWEIFTAISDKRAEFFFNCRRDRGA